MQTTENIHTEDYRNTLSTSTQAGGRIRIYPKILTGRFYHWREVVAYLLLALMAIGPLVEIDGHPLFLFNILTRKFILFGIPFWPQDFFVLALGLLTFMVFIVLFTVIYGRVWCGWACPQTIFMEMVFRRIETWIEGDFHAQQRFDNEPWSANKILRKTAKHFIFFALSFFIANLFLAYIIGKKALSGIVADNPANHIVGLISILVFTGVFYFVFAKFRELVCIIVCPYGRLQGVLLDKKSIVVAYDYKRGEPRGAIKKGTDTAHLGDCVDCKLCVHVCPTGIDIRNGTQLECVNCTACIDACDSVMHKIGRPKDLIKYASLEGIEKGEKLKFNFRIAAYTLVLSLLVGLLTFMLVTRSDVETTILRTPGMLYQELPGGKVSNLYNYELVNKTFKNIPVSFQCKTEGAKIKFVGNNKLADIPGEDILKGSFFIEMPKSYMRSNKTNIEIDVVSKGKVIDHVKTSFPGPM